MCPDCRMQRRLAFRNERTLYHRTCDLTGKPIISIYSTDKPYRVYQQDAWWSDAWDPRDYSRDYDFNRSFFEQFEQLKKEVPRMTLETSPEAEENNCLYINFAGHSKNCYMIFDSDFNEDSYYTKVLKHSKSCMDCSYVHYSELCYECVNCSNCYGLVYSENCANCSDSTFLKNCIGCKNCLFSSNLRQKEYYIWNKPYSKDEYQKIKHSLNLGSFKNLEQLKKDFSEFTKKFPQKYVHILKAENATGDYLTNVEDCHVCYDLGNAQHMRYCDSIYEGRHCMDVSSFGENIELIYESTSVGINCYNIQFSLGAVISCSDLLYCDECRMSNHCFGCVGLKRNSYCILNKQYTKEEYGELVPRIIESMAIFGDFFPTSLSPFGYNETVAPEHFPLAKDEALRQGWKWKDQSEATYKPATLAAEKIPDHIKEINQTLCKQILACVNCNKNYKVIQQELKLYHQLGIPIPRKCPDCRHMERLAQRNPRRLIDRNCQKCNIPVKSTFTQDRPEPIYCEKCYAHSL